MIQLLRALVFGALAWILARALASVFSPPARRSTGGGQPGSTPRQGGAPERLVRDPVCGVNLPERRALAAKADSGRVFFCSEECRRAWLSRQAPAS